MAKRPRRDLPPTGPPGATVEKTDDSGNVIQKRMYGKDGRAVTNIDYGHDHTGVGDPHAHDWDWSKVPPRQPPRPLKSGE